MPSLSPLAIGRPDWVSTAAGISGRHNWASTLILLSPPYMVFTISGKACAVSGYLDWRVVFAYRRRSASQPRHSGNHVPSPAQEQRLFALLTTGQPSPVRVSETPHHVFFLAREAFASAFGSG